MARSLRIVTLLMLVVPVLVQASQPTLLLKFSGNGYQDESVIRFMEGATGDFDNNYDAWKLVSPNPAVPAIFTKDGTGNPLAINSQPLLDASHAFELYTIIPVTGNYTLSVEEPGSFPAGTAIGIYDKTGGNYFDLRNGAVTLPFNADPEGNAAQLVLHILILPQFSALSPPCAEFTNGRVLITSPGDSVSTGVVRRLKDGSLVAAGPVYQLDTIQGLDTGSYTVTVHRPFSVSLSDTLNISPAPVPVAGFYASQGSPDHGALPVSFVNTSIDAVSYLWDFGDGIIDSAESPVHLYTTAGTFLVKLTAISSSGCSSVFSLPVKLDDFLTSGSVMDESHASLYSYGGNIRVQIAENCSVNLFDLTGKLVRQFNGSPGQVVPLPGISPGVYIYSLSSGRQIQTGRIYLH